MPGARLRRATGPASGSRIQQLNECGTVLRVLYFFTVSGVSTGEHACHYPSYDRRALKLRIVVLGGCLMAIGMPYEPWTYERRDRLARTKRFLEMWSADPHVREQLMGLSDLTIKAPILATFDPEELNALRNFTSELLRPRNSIREYCCAPVISDYLEYKSFKVEKSERARADAAPADSSWRRWRARQMARCHLTLASELNDAIIHAPFAIELGD